MVLLIFSISKFSLDFSRVFQCGESFCLKPFSLHVRSCLTGQNTWFDWSAQCCGYSNLLSQRTSTVQQSKSTVHYLYDCSKCKALYRHLVELKTTMMRARIKQVAVVTNLNVKCFARKWENQKFEQDYIRLKNAIILDNFLSQKLQYTVYMQVYSIQYRSILAIFVKLKNKIKEFKLRSVTLMLVPRVTILRLAQMRFK